MNESESPKAYYFRIYEGKIKHQDWCEKIPCDPNINLCHEGKVEHLRGPYDRKEEKIIDGQKYEEVDDLPF